YDGVGWYFEWNGENRMIEARNYADIMNPSSGAVRLTFTYDYQGRRVEKTVEEYDVPLASMQTVSEERFIYDGWNLIATFSSQVSGLSHQATYLWGQDLSGSMQGAGGVGGLLSVLDKSSSDVFYPTYDANGNVSEYLDETGAIAAHYEYSSFGRVIASTGAPDDFAFRFSTKYQDNETDLLYYGFRYYVPETSRWASRDPIEEEGGPNLYAFVGNDGVNAWDYLGKQGKLGRLTDFWYVERRLNPTGDSAADRFIKALNLQHAFVLKSESPCAPLKTDPGYGFYMKGVTREKVIITQLTTAQQYRVKGVRSRFRSGSKEGTRCDCASDEDILECIRTFPPSRSYYVPPANLRGLWEFLTGKKYACDDWAEEAASACCLNKTHIKKTCGQN
ncbi:RHS repeat domain-containing protein, partial [Puniceicoccus vermicola]